MGWSSVAVHAHIFESFNLSNICNQVVTTTLRSGMPFGESLDDCSHGFIMLSYILPAHDHVWVLVAPKDVALRVITSAERVLCVPGYSVPRHV